MGQGVAGGEWARRADVVAAAVEDAPMPGVAVAVFDMADQCITFSRGLADATLDEPLTLDHVWNLASLTKTLVTLPEVLALADDGVIDLDVPLGRRWPRSVGSVVGTATPADLLSYRAGLPASGDFFHAEGLSRDDRVALVLATERVRPARTDAVYSDIGLIALGEMVRDLREEGLSDLARRRSGLEFRQKQGPVVATEICPGVAGSSRARCTTRTRRPWREWRGTRARSER